MKEQSLLIKEITGKKKKGRWTQLPSTRKQRKRSNLFGTKMSDKLLISIQSLRNLKQM